MTEITATFTHSGSGVRLLGTELLPYRYTITATMDHDGEGPEEDEIITSLKKCHIFLDDIFSGGLIISVENELATRFYDPEKTELALDNHPILFPDEPTDAIMASILFYKLNAFMMGDLHLTALTFKEEMGAGLSYTVTGEDDLFPSMAEWMGDHYYDQPWWHRDDPTVADLEVDDVTVKPVYAIDWKIEEPKSEVIRPSFKPTIIDGKKND